MASTETAAQERTGVITFKGNPLTLIGPEIKVGSKAPDFEVLSQDLSPVTLASSKGKTRLIVAVPSLDTPVCDVETRRFNKEAANLPGGIEIITVSTDLPFAQKRWCGAAGIDKIQVVSDHKDASLGIAFGVLIKELRLLTRAIFVVDASDDYSSHVLGILGVRQPTVEPGLHDFLGPTRAVRRHHRCPHRDGFQQYVRQSLKARGGNDQSRKSQKPEAILPVAMEGDTVGQPQLAR